MSFFAVLITCTVLLLLIFVLAKSLASSFDSLVALLFKLLNRTPPPSQHEELKESIKALEEEIKALRAENKATRDIVKSLHRRVEVIRTAESEQKKQWFKDWIQLQLDKNK